MKPLQLDIPLFVSDMSVGALSEEAKIAMAKGAELAGIEWSGFDQSGRTTNERC